MVKQVILRALLLAISASFLVACGSKDETRMSGDESQAGATATNGGRSSDDEAGRPANTGDEGGTRQDAAGGNQQAAGKAADSGGSNSPTNAGGVASENIGGRQSGGASALGGHASMGGHRSAGGDAADGAGRPSSGGGRLGGQDASGGVAPSGGRGDIGGQSGPQAGRALIGGTPEQGGHSASAGSSAAGGHNTGGLLAGGAPAGGDDDPLANLGGFVPQGPSVWDVAQTRNDLTRFVAAVEQAGLDTALDSPSAYTVFAPSDAAFNAYPNLQELLSNRVKLIQTLNYHLHHGELDTAEIRTRNQIATIGGLSLVVTFENDAILLNGARLVVSNIEASNGVIHIIDAVLDVEEAPRPSTLVEVLEADERFRTFARLMRETNYDQELSEEGPFTVFAPTDDAFDQLNAEREGFVSSLDLIQKEQLVASHLLEGRFNLEALRSTTGVVNFRGINLPIEVDGAAISVAEAPVLEADIGADNPNLNGLVHATREVIFRERNPTLGELLANDGRFSVFLELASGVPQTQALLNDEAWDELVTVFVPVDEAFDGQDLQALRDNQEFRVDFVNRHITLGEYYVEDLGALQRLSMLNGRFVTVTADAQDNISLEDARVLEADLYAHNGMAHVLNASIQIPDAPEPATCDEPRALALGDSVLGNNDNADGIERFEFAIPAGGTVCLSTVGSPIDTTVLVRETCDGAGAPLAENDNVLDGVMYQSQLTLTAEAVTSYYVEVGAQGSLGDFVLDVTEGACESPLSLLDILETLPGFDSFLISLQIAGLIDRLDETNADLTVLAVREAGYDYLDMFQDGASELLLGDTPRLTLIIEYHLISGTYPTSSDDPTIPALQWNETLETLNGQSVSIETRRVGQPSEKILFDEKEVKTANYVANNGIVHVLDRLLEPKTPCPHPELSCGLEQVCLNGFCAEPPPPKNLVDELRDAGQFTELLALIEAAELAEELQNAEMITLFAPTDEALRAIEAESPGTLDALKDDTDALRAILYYHMVSHELTAHGLFSIDRVLTLAGLVVEIDAGPLGVFVGDATIEDALVNEEERTGSNGRYHPLTGLLTPPIPQPVGTCANPIPVNQAGRIIGTTLGENQQSELDTVCTETCGPANSPESVIEFRPSEGGNYCLYTEHSAYDTVISIRSRCLDQTSEIECNDDSAFAGSYFSAVELKDAVAEQAYYVIVDGCSRRNRPAGEGGNYLLTIRKGLCSNPDTIVDRLQAENAKYRTTLHALRVSGLDDLLKREAKHTLFAPTEQAWEVLEEVDPGIVQRLTNDPADFERVLLYHLIAGEHSSNALNEAGTTETLDGHFVEVFKRGDRVFANGFGVPDTDVEADNGLIHAVDSVLLVPNRCENGADCGNDFRCLNQQCMSLPPPGTIIDELADSGQFTTFLAFAEATGLTRTLENESPLTIFAPTDEAFQLFRQRDAAGYQDVLDRPEEMNSLVLYHIVTGEEPEAALLMAETLTTDEGNTISLAGEPGRISVNGKFLLETDRPAFNGIIHTLDGVLRPPQEPDACEAPIAIAVDQEVLSGSTVDRGARYGSTCGGLAESKEVVYQYRPEQDERVCVSTTGSQFDTVLHIREEECEELATQANCPDAVDLTCCNDDSEHAGGFASALTLNARAGVDYFIFVDGFGGDNSGEYSIRISSGACGQQAPTDNITDLLTDDGRFTVFLQGLTSAGIQQALGSDDEQHTVFAPTDAAFAALGEQIAANPGGEFETLDDLVRNRAAFGQLIKYHVSAGQFYSDQLAARGSLQSLAEDDDGQTIPLLLQMFGSQVVVTDVIVGDIDIPATNGVVHTIDEVLTIPNACLADAECSAEQICGNAGYCIRRPQPGTCQAPYRIQGLQTYRGDTGENNESPSFNYLQGSCGGGAGVEHVWMFEPPLINDEIQEYCFLTTGSDFDTVLHARRNNCGDGSAELTCNDDNRFITGEQGSSAITVRASAGDLIYVVVDGWADISRGDYELEVRIGSCEGGF